MVDPARCFGWTVLDRAFLGASRVGLPASTPIFFSPVQLSASVTPSLSSLVALPFLAGGGADRVSSDGRRDVFAGGEDPPGMPAPPHPLFPSCCTKRSAPNPKVSYLYSDLTELQLGSTY